MFKVKFNTIYISYNAQITAQSAVLDTFAKLQKAAVNLNISVCSAICPSVPLSVSLSARPSVCPSVRQKQLGSHVTDFVKFGVWGFLKIYREIFCFH